MRDFDRLFGLALMAAGLLLWFARRRGGWAVTACLLLMTVLLAVGIGRVGWEFTTWRK